jgi:putative NADH-flavin reductase
MPSPARGLPENSYIIKEITLNLALFGATGRTGGLILKLALSAGHQVTVLIRDPRKLMEPQSGLRIVQGNAREGRDVTETVQGVDAVISALGGGGDTLTLFGRNAIAAMDRMGVRRIVSLVGASMVVSGDPKTIKMSMLRLITHTFARDMLKDGEGHATELAESTLDYTLVRPPRLTDGPATGRIEHNLSLNLGPASSISRGDLASFMLDVAVTGKYIRAAPMVAGLR